METLPAFVAVERAWRSARSRLLGFEVHALIGRSGTGKSFRGALLVHKYGLEAIIDDGLLIADGKILAGHSAKRESQFLAATKTACFYDPDHRRQVREAIANRRLRRILVLGTSDRMVMRNCQRLGLPPPSRIIRIEDVATREEIAAATHDRRVNGRHVIPIPIIEVSRSYPRMIAESITIWLQRGRFRFLLGRRRVEKTIVRPEFTLRGEVTISEGVLVQMVLHCIAEREPEVTVSRVRVKNAPAGFRIKIGLSVPFGRELPASMHQLHDAITTEIEAYTGIRIGRLSLSIDEFAEPKPARC